MLTRILTVAAVLIILSLVAGFTLAWAERGGR